MQKAFEEASFALKVNELSDIVSTDSGEHLILRIQWPGHIRAIQQGGQSMVMPSSTERKWRSEEIRCKKAGAVGMMLGNPLGKAHAETGWIWVAISWPLTAVPIQNPDAHSLQISWRDLCRIPERPKEWTLTWQWFSMLGAPCLSIRDVIGSMLDQFGSGGNVQSSFEICNLVGGLEHVFYFSIYWE